MIYIYHRIQNFKMKKIFTLILGLLMVLSIETKAQTEVTFYTTDGIFIAMMYDSIMPITVGNFLDLVDSNYYDGIIFHRIIDNFVIQGGDPTGTGTGGPGYSIPDEFDGTLSNVQKTLSMANSGPNTGGSQFFINLVDNTFLDFDKAPLTSKHPVFGIVVNNWLSVSNIGKLPVNATNRPITDVVMDSVRVTPAAIGLKDHTLNSGLHIYPNPVNEKSQVFAQFSRGGIGEMTLVSVDGKTIQKHSIELKSGNNSIRLEKMGISKLQKGIYQINISLGHESYNTKFVIE